MEDDLEDNADDVGTKKGTGHFDENEVGDVRDNLEDNLKTYKGVELCRGWAFRGSAALSQDFLDFRHPGFSFSAVSCGITGK